MTNQQNITEAVRALAAIAGDTNASLGQVLGRSESSAAGKRTGRIKWTFDDMEKLSLHYRVTIAALVAGPRGWLSAEGQGWTLDGDGINVCYDPFGPVSFAA